MTNNPLRADEGRLELQHLQALTDAALAHLELDALLSALLDRARQILDVDTVAILLLDEETGELVARAALGIEEEVELGVRIPVGGGFAGRIAAERRPVVLADVDHADILNPILREKGIKSMVGVPLIVEGHVLGVMHVGSLTPRTFAATEIALLQLAADRAAIGIEHARLYAAERGARARMENLQQITDAALGYLDVDELLSVLLPRIRDILSTDTCAVLLLDRETNELVARAALGIEEEVEQGVRIPVGGGFAGRVAAEQRPVILPNLDTAHVLNPILRQKGLRSMLGVPLIVRGSTTGVLHVGTLTFRDFTSTDVEMLELVAARVAIAVERAQLHEATVQLEQMKANFVAIASHELRTPATSVYGVFATLVSRELTDELRDQLIATGFEQADRLRRLLEELLDLSRLDAHAIAIEPRPLVMHSVLSDLVTETLLTDDDIELDVAGDLAVVADPLVIDRVVSNLLINASRYGKPPITVHAQRTDHHLRIAVEDRGAGVPDALRPRLFDRFARADTSSSSGLGLAIARAYARAHGGDLFYEPLDDGSRFELVIPQD